MHITSLPGPYGIGCLGKEAFRFVDFLKKAGQRYWQLLPLNPTGFGDSPYQSFCAWAGNPYLIDLDALKEQGLLTQEELSQPVWEKTAGRVDFGIQYQLRFQLLALAKTRFRPGKDYDAFLEENQSWLRDYALFMAIKGKVGNRPWPEWPEELKLHKADALSRAEQELKEEIEFQYFLQYQFDRQWRTLRAYAQERGIRIIGDVPIYVPLDSADVWSNHELFLLDEQHRPHLVAGCPPDSFTAEGQLWGNPLYDWEALRQTGYDWWIRRLAAAAKMFDVVRLDHFRGFESYWAVPAGDATAKNGRWVKGPGIDFIRAIRAALPTLQFIAEDLGYITPEVRQLQVDSGCPGMKVMEFAFDSREAGNYLPHLYPVDSICYTGTHDNVTLKQWFDEALPQDIAYAKAYLGLNQEEGYIWGMIRGAMSSVSRLCVVQMQDFLELGREARMNFPGTLSPDNWTWRAEEGFDSDALAQRILSLTKLYGRA